MSLLTPRVLFHLYHGENKFIFNEMMIRSVFDEYEFPLRGIRRVWRCQRGNQNLYIEEEQTTQWPKEKAQKDKQRSTKHTYKTKDRVTRTPLNILNTKLKNASKINNIPIFFYINRCLEHCLQDVKISQ